MRVALMLDFALLLYCVNRSFLNCQIKMLDTLFDTLYQLVNLLVVQPDNLKQVCSGEQLVRPTIRILLHLLHCVLLVPSQCHPDD